MKIHFVTKNNDFTRTKLTFLPLKEKHVSYQFDTIYFTYDK